MNINESIRIFSNFFVILDTSNRDFFSFGVKQTKETNGYSVEMNSTLSFKLSREEIFFK